jgi:hypothetical protein
VGQRSLFDPRSSPGEIETDRVNVHGGRLLSCVGFGNEHFRKTDAGSGTVHLIETIWLGFRVLTGGQHNEIVNSDREATHPDARCMPDGVCNGTTRACDADFADTFDTESVYMGIELVDQERL